jgi:hypothetical protein
LELEPKSIPLKKRDALTHGYQTFYINPGFSVFNFLFSFLGFR